MFGTILAVIMTLLVVGGATGAVMYRVLDRSDTGSTSENGAVVEPIYGSPSPEPEEEVVDEQTSPDRSQDRQTTPTPERFIFVPGVVTPSPTPFHHEEEEPTPHDTPEQDEEFQTEEPTPGFEDSNPGS